MSRANLQFVVGLALGFLTIFLFRDRNNPGGEFLSEANIIAGAAATMIAPRLWWTGVIALWFGQSAAVYSWLVKDGQPADLGTLQTALLYPQLISGQHVLLGAVLGGALWYAVDRRRKKSPTQPLDCSPPL